MLISVSSFGKSELEIPAGVFCSGRVRNVSGAAILQCFSAAHSAPIHNIRKYKTKFTFWCFRL